MATQATFEDRVQPFQIESAGIRGRLVRLGATVDAILRRHDYPEPVAALLGEALVLAAMLADGLKFDGVFTVQANGDGPVRFLVADVTTDGHMRGYAQFDAAQIEPALADGAPGAPGAPGTPGTSVASVPRLLGAGHLAFTVDQGERKERYQGIVELTGGSLAECAHVYFRQSEQIPASLKIAIAPPGEADDWRAAGLMIQTVPEAGTQAMAGDSSQALDDAAEAWRRAVVLMDSCASRELLDPDLHVHRLLYRLFHEDGVRVFESGALLDRCRCSAEKVERTLRSFPRAEIEDMKIDGKVIVTCEFCASDYVYDDADLDALYEIAQG